MVDRSGCGGWGTSRGENSSAVEVFFVPGPQPWAPADEDMDVTALNLLAPISWRRASNLDLYLVEPGRLPWWPNERAGCRDNSIFGPLVNPETGQAVDRLSSAPR